MEDTPRVPPAYLSFGALPRDDPGTVCGARVNVVDVATCGVFARTLDPDNGTATWRVATYGARAKVVNGT